ncbi:MAG: phosphomannomutase/phosphoglucomutase [Oscillospiraceae bacterium]|nr:phosphomannomutase/phosphoglucomutase [Candidatus Ruminococcus equi]
MLNEYYAHFKSGTDIRGTAVDGVEGEPLDLTNEAVEEMATGFLLWLSDYVEKKVSDLTVSVGRDCRISGERISACVRDTFKKYGVKVYDCSLSSTPSMFMSTLDIPCDGAVQITASHHPYNKNGLKFFTKNGGLDHGDITAILQYAQDKTKPELCDGEEIQINFMKQYAEHLRNLIKEGVNAENYDKPLAGFHIVVDAGNGVGGFYAGEVLEPLGADVSGSRYLEPDGMFPNHIPNPENDKAMESICEAVLENKADLGVIFDTDVDRGGAVDSFGKEINRNRLVALSSLIALEGNKGGTVVTDSITSTGLTEFLEKELKAHHYRYRRGYKNIINKAVELNEKGINCPIASETSGHVAMRENYFLDDGAYLCTRIIIKMAVLQKEGRTIDELLKNLKEPKESKEIRIKILEKDFKNCGECVIESLTNYASEQKGWNIAPDNREGIRVSFDKDNGDGWFLLRLSVHDPILPLNIESDSVGGVEIIEKKVFDFLRENTSGLAL